MVLRSKIITVSDEPELIDLESSDEETIDDTRVEVINLDESEIAGDEQSSEDKSPPDINSVESHSDVSPLQRKGISSKSPSPCTSSSDDSKGIVKEITDIVILNDFDVDDSVRQQSEDQSIVNISTLDDSVYVVNDSTMEKSSMESSLSDTDTGKVLTISNKQAKKRKLESEMLKDIEVVELLDDDIIVLDDSIQIPTPEKDSNVILTETVAKWNSWRRLHDTENLTGAVCTSSRSNSPDPPLSDTNESCESRKVTGIIENESGESEIDKSQITNPPKKKSKLAYHRPAHLVTPLTKPAPDIPCTKTDTVSNIYNPNAGSAEKRTGLRPIVVDGNNVGISHGKGTFSLNGIKICVNFFEKRGHRQIKVFVPQYRKNRNTHDDLQKMERNGLVVITPSRKVNGKVIASYDDRYIVQYAAEFGGVIVSTDNYRDLMDENPNWKDTIESRLLMFTWVDDLLMFPQDPLGRNGPSLDDFLKFPDS